ncbi:zinc C2H2 type domain-containing protein [Babesia ovis]|uniref:Zinc C2H2 type domain-containing protein n=1 Tax=Babesia ovis TaxID=5869 RepID=A0A9W5TEU0_BABOV|nr:zinc C2H2 type domain-containing protein [Babesia ovis]
MPVSEGLCFFKGSAKSRVAAIPESNKCVTCNAQFADITAQKRHFKSEWHLYNVKRKGSGIAPVREDEFVRLRENLAQIMALRNSEIETKNRSKLSRKSMTRSRGGQSGLESGNHTNGTTIGADSGNQIHGTTIGANSGHDNTDSGNNNGTPNNSIRADSGNQTNSTSASNTSCSSTSHNGATYVPYDPVTCIFSGNKSSSLEENIKSMSLKYSFFIPEREYLISPEGLLGYLHDKIWNQYTCIYCHKPFSSIYAVHHHMEQKQHRKLNDDDLEELSQFYDFTRSYVDLLKQEDVSAAVPARGSSEDDDWEDEDNWEDVITAKTDHNEAIQTLSGYGLSRARINPSGNLTLPNGREAVHRDVSYVYKQHLVVRGSYGIGSAPTGFQFLPASYRKHIKLAEKQKRTKLEHGSLRMQYKSYRLFVPCNQIAYAT